MHHHLFLLTALLLLLLTALSLSNCNRTFSCGRLVNISYPFTSSDRPKHCGPPEFHLSCDCYYPELTADSLTYVVWAVNQTRRSLTLVRTDFFNITACSQHYANTTLNSTIFTVASDREGLALFLECSKLTNINPDNQFSCKINGTETNSYYLIGAVPTDPNLNGSKCEKSVTVPIQPFAANMLTADGSRLREALVMGFELNYTNPYEDQCVMCRGIGGQCGFDTDQGKPICICGDQICPTSLSKPIPTAGSNRWRKLIIGGVSAIGASISIIAIIFTWKVLIFKN